MLSDGSLSFLPVINGQLYRCSYPAEAFKGLPSLAAHEAEKPGPRDLHNFKRAEIFEDQAEPMGFVLAPDETIYGVSDADGKFKHGTLFKLKTDGSGFIVLHDFYGGDDDGESPTSLLLLPDGSLFGTAEKGFHYDPKSQQFAIVTLDAKDHVPNMLAGSAADGTIVGFGGGLPSWTRRMWSAWPPMAATTSASQTARMPNRSSCTSQIIAGKDGTFFAIGMVQDKAVLVKFKSLKDTPTLVHKFAALPTDGNRPDANLVLDNKGNLYGSTSAGGMSQNGVIYKINADGSNYQVVYNPDTFAFSKYLFRGMTACFMAFPRREACSSSTRMAAGSRRLPSSRLMWAKIVTIMGRLVGCRISSSMMAPCTARDNAAIYKVTLPKAGGPALRPPRRRWRSRRSSPNPWRVRRSPLPIRRAPHPPALRLHRHPQHQRQPNSRRNNHRQRRRMRSKARKPRKHNNRRQRHHR